MAKFKAKQQQPTVNRLLLGHRSRSRDYGQFAKPQEIGLRSSNPPVLGFKL